MPTKLLATISALLLTFIATTSLKAQTGHPFWPCNNGSSITYNIYSFTGQWNGYGPMSISVTSRTYLYNLTLTCSTVYDPGLSTNLYAQVFAGGGTLYNAPFEASGFRYLGEATQANVPGAATGYLSIPYECKIVYDIKGAEVIDASNVTVMYNYAVTSTTYHWRYATLGHLKTWVGWNDVWWTGLLEGPNTSPSMVYNYLFANGIGMVGYYQGQPDATGFIGQDSQHPNNQVAYYYYAVSHNP
jgi:hypothetical protein